MSYKLVDQILKSSRASLGGLSATQKSILVALAGYARDDGTNAWPSINTLSAQVCLCRRTVIYGLQALEKQGAIEKVEAGGGRSKTNRYRIRAPQKVHGNAVQRVQTATFCASEKVHQATEKDAINDSNGAGDASEPVNGGLKAPYVVSKKPLPETDDETDERQADAYRNHLMVELKRTAGRIPPTRTPAAFSMTGGHGHHSRPPVKVRPRDWDEACFCEGEDPDHVYKTCRTPVKRTDFHLRFRPAPVAAQEEVESDEEHDAAYYLRPEMAHHFTPEAKAASAARFREKTRLIKEQKRLQRELEEKSTEEQRRASRPLLDPLPF